MLKLYTWYQWNKDPLLTIYTRYNNSLGGGNGFRFVKQEEGGDWKIDTSSDYTFTFNSHYQEANIKDFDIPSRFFRHLIQIAFETSHKY